MGVKDVSACLAKAARAMKKEDQVCALRLAEMASKHSSEAFYALDDPLEGSGVLGVCEADQGAWRTSKAAHL